MEEIHSAERKRQPVDALGFILIGPSGAGKSTLRDAICRQNIVGHSFVCYTPTTSRLPRPGQSEYNFVTDAEFDQLLQSDAVLFNNSSYGNRFLTTWPPALRSNQHYMYIYLPEAASKFKMVFPNTKIIQVIPPDLSVIEQRIRMRDPALTQDELSRRLSGINSEILAGRQIADEVFLNAGTVDESAQNLSDMMAQLL